VLSALSAESFVLRQMYRLHGQAGKRTLRTQASLRHFDKAFRLSCIGQPGTYLTTWFLAELISEKNAHLGILLKK